MQDFGIALILQLAFFALLLAEIVLPSMGILTIASLAALGTSYWFASQSQVVWATTAIIIADVILTPPLVWAGLRYMGRSPLANKVSLDATAGYHSHVETKPDWIGLQAEVQSALRPSGKIKFTGNGSDDQSHEAISSGEFIEAGAFVQVISVTENKLIVERTQQGA